MKIGSILFILILIVVLVFVLYPLWKDIPVFEGIEMPDLGFGIGGIGQGLGEILEGITRSIKF